MRQPGTPQEATREATTCPSPFHGDRLKTLRTERGWPRADLADHIGSDAARVSRYENGFFNPEVGVSATRRSAG